MTNRLIDPAKPDNSQPELAKSSAKASALCGLTRLQFEDLLGKRKVLRHYGDAELEEDLKYARRS